MKNLVTLAREFSLFHIKVVTRAGKVTLLPFWEVARCTVNCDTCDQQPKE